MRPPGMARLSHTLLVASLASGCMMSHPDAATPVASQTEPQSFWGYGPDTYADVEMHCRPPGDDTDTIFATTTSSNYALPWAGTTISIWEVTAAVPSQCWTPVGPGESGANVWARVDGHDAERVEDPDCAGSLTNFIDLPSCSGAASWTRLVAPDGSPFGADPLAGDPIPTVIASGLSFAEGPVWQVEHERLLFTDIQTDTIWQVSPGSPATVLSSGEDTHTNGQAVDLTGQIIQHVLVMYSKDVARITLMPVIHE